MKLDNTVPETNVEEGVQSSSVTSVSVSLDDSTAVSENEYNTSNITKLSNTNDAMTLPDGSVITYGARTWYKQLFTALQSPQFKQVGANRHHQH